MAIVISGVNNNDKITASDGTIDLLSGVNFNSELTVPSFKIGSNIQFGNAGVATATTFVGNLTGNVNATSNLLLQIGGSEKFRVASSGQLGIGGANYGSAGQVLTSGGSGSAATWSTISGTTINNNANYRLITGDANSNELNAESNFTYNGDVATITRSANAAGGLSIINTNNSQASAHARLELSAGDNSSAIMRMECNGHANELIADGSGNFKIDDNGTQRLRIDSAGDVFINTTTDIAPTNGTNLCVSDATISRIILEKQSTIKFGLNVSSGFTIYDETNNGARFLIDQYGLVTRPFQYHLHADRTGNQTGYNAGGDFGTPMIFNQIVSETKDSSLSSCFNTSNGLFTAPVTGLYLFNASVYVSGNILSQSWFTLNGGRAAGTDWVINSGYAFVQNSQVMRLSVGNTVGFKPYGGGQSNVTIQANNNHTYFKVTLIG